jgi:hypothetical protein
MNNVIESLRAECLDVHWFASIAEAKHISPRDGARIR